MLETIINLKETEDVDTTKKEYHSRIIDSRGNSCDANAVVTWRQAFCIIGFCFLFHPSFNSVDIVGRYHKEQKN